MKDLINLTQNLNCFEFYPEIEGEEDLSHHYIVEMCTLEILGQLKNYVDYEAYGPDMSMGEARRFSENSYVVRTGDSFNETYMGKDDIPDEYRIFAYPKGEKLSIRDIRKRYQ